MRGLNELAYCIHYVAGGALIRKRGLTQIFEHFH